MYTDVQYFLLLVHCIIHTLYKTMLPKSIITFLSCTLHLGLLNLFVFSLHNLPEWQAFKNLNLTNSNKVILGHGYALTCENSEWSKIVVVQKLKYTYVPFEHSFSSYKLSIFEIVIPITLISNWHGAL